MEKNFEEQVGITEAMESDEELIKEDEEAEETEDEDEDEEAEETEDEDEGIDMRDVAAAGLVVAGIGTGFYVGWKIGGWILTKFKKDDEKSKDKTPLYKRIHFQMPIVIDQKKEFVEPEIIDPKNKTKDKK